MNPFSDHINAISLHICHCISYTFSVQKVVKSCFFVLKTAQCLFSAKTFFEYAKMKDIVIRFKDNLRTIEARFPKNLRSTEAHFDFTGPYKRKLSFPSEMRLALPTRGALAY